MKVESKDSYLNVEQFEFLQRRLEDAHKRLKEQQAQIDKMEEKMITHLQKRKQKEEDIA
jgi:hypothetical protein